MVPGLFGAPLKQLSGYIPPQSSLDFDLVTDSEVEMIVAKKLKNSGLTLASQSDGKGIAQAVDFSEVKHANFLKLPHGLEGFFDYQQGVAYAKQVNKPIFIDFTGHGCVNCREMEARVWSDEEVLKRLQEEYVVIALYVDDRKTLPENEWYKSEYDQKVKKTIGQQNADLQIVKFNNNAQPFYTLLDHSGTLLVKPEAYNLNIQNFVDFLDIGVKNFQEKKNIATR
jgi:thiol:disulfide interchange protein DsbD